MCTSVIIYITFQFYCVSQLYIIHSYHPRTDPILDQHLTCREKCEGHHTWHSAWHCTNIKPVKTSKVSSRKQTNTAGTAGLFTGCGRTAINMCGICHASFYVSDMFRFPCSHVHAIWGIIALATDLIALGCASCNYM